MYVKKYVASGFCPTKFCSLQLIGTIFQHPKSSQQLKKNTYGKGRERSSRGGGGRGRGGEEEGKKWQGGEGGKGEGDGGGESGRGVEKVRGGEKEGESTFQICHTES